MQNLMIGMVLLVLACCVVFGFIYETAGPGFGVDEPAWYEQDEIRFLDESSSVTIELRRDRNPLLNPSDPGLDHDLVPEDLIPPWERKNIDEQGYYHYRVKPFDTLSEIASVYLGRANLWKLLMEHNTHLVDPREVQEGTMIRIPLWLRVNK